MLPGALPQTLVGLRQSLGVAWLSLIVAETSQRRLRARLHDQPRPGVPAHRRDRRRPGRLQPARPRHRRARPPASRGGRWHGAPEHLRDPRARRRSGDAVAGSAATTASFGDTHVLDALDLTIGRGEFVALLGRSGSGKSTLLRSLAGLDPAPKGEVAGHRPHRRSPSRSPGCCRGSGSRDNVALGAAQRRRERQPRRARRAALAEVGLTDKPDAWPLHAVRRPGPARLARPGPGQRARPAAARRAVQRARRADPDRDAPARASSSGRGTGRPSCSSPTTSTRRCAGRPRARARRGPHRPRAGRSPLRRTARARRSTEIADLRAELLGALGVERPETRSSTTEPRSSMNIPPHRPPPSPRSSAGRRRRRRLRWPAAAAPRPATRPPSTTTARSTCQGHPHRRRPEGRLQGPAPGRRRARRHRRTRSSGSQFTSGPPLLEALNAGAIDIGGVGNTPPLFAAAGEEQDQGRLRRATTARQGRRDRGAEGLRRSRASRTSRARRSRSPRAARPTTTCSPSSTKAGLGFNDIDVEYLQPADALAAFTGGPRRRLGDLGPLHLAGRARGRRAGARRRQRPGQRLRVPGRRPTTRSTDKATSAALKDYLARLAKAQVWGDTHQDEWAKVWAEETGLPEAITAAPRTTRVRRAGPDRRRRHRLRAGDGRRLRRERACSRASSTSRRSSPTSSTPIHDREEGTST